ncbi:MAG: hypothetical protein J5755_02465 [Clostridia bacterium]|nr:hypothetical protein [Clostridia bacterium]
MDYQELVATYCREEDVDVRLSFDMPEGYETAYGNYDPAPRTLYLNRELLDQEPPCVRLFYLYHELRHASQYQRPDRFDSLLVASLRYVVSYDGTCFKQTGEEWRECRLEGGPDRFADLYLAQPYERDANDYAYAKVKSLRGDAPDLVALHDFWTPKRPVDPQALRDLYREIDAAVG